MQGIKSFSKKNSAIVKWEHQENAHLEKLCGERELTVVHPDKDGRKHEATADYKARKRREALAKEIEELETKKSGLMMSIDNVIGPYIKLYLKAIESTSKIVNQIKKMEAFDEVNSFGSVNIALETAIQNIENNSIPSDEEQMTILNAIPKLQVFCEDTEESEKEM